MFDILLMILSFIVIMILGLWCEILNLKFYYKDKKEIRCEDERFIWLLKNKRWLRYDKKDDLWVIMSIPPS